MLDGVPLIMRFSWSWWCPLSCYFIVPYRLEVAGGLSSGLGKAAADVEAGAYNERFLTGLRRRTWRKRRAGRESQAKDARREIECFLASCRELEGKEGRRG